MTETEIEIEIDAGGKAPDTVEDPRPTPLPDDLTLPFWENAAAGRLVVQQCESCGRMQYPPDVVCNACQSRSLRYSVVSGRASLYSYAVVERAFHPGFIEHLPYVVALVELSEQPGLLLLTNIVGTPPEELSVGMNLEVSFEQRATVTLPLFRIGGQR